MRKDFLVYSGMLVVGLASAYYVSLPRSEKSSEQSEWVSIDPKSVSLVKFTSEKGTVEITRSPNGFFAKTDQVDDNALCKPDDKACKEQRVTESFKVSKKFDDALAAFNPLYVLRKLGKSKDLKLSEFALDKDTSMIEISTGDKAALSLIVGKKSYGSRNAYAIDKKSDEVILFAADVVEDIERARNRLFQRDVIDVPMDTITGAKLVVGSDSKELAHTKRDGGGEILWTLSGSEQAIPSLKSFMGQVEKLNVQRYATQEEAKTIAELKPFASLTFSKDRKDLMTVHLLKQSDGKDQNFWALNTAVGVPVLLNHARAEGLEKDLPTIMGK